MRPVIANILIAGSIAALPLAAIGQNAMPVIPALPLAHRAPPRAKAPAAAVPNAMFIATVTVIWKSGTMFLRNLTVMSQAS